MNLLFSTIIPMKAIPKGRPRLGRGKRVFTPKRTADFERAIQNHLILSFRSKPIQGAVQVNLLFYFKRPNKPVHAYPSIGDLDNYAKGVCDAANEILYFDDSQITNLVASKCYGLKDEIHIALWA